MDLDFDRNIMIQCVECCKVFSIDEAEAINEATSSVKCSCGRWNFVDCPSIFQRYVDQTIEEDEGGKLYDFRTGRLEDEFPRYAGRNSTKPRLTVEEKKQIEKEKTKMIKELKKEYKKVMGLK